MDGRARLRVRGAPAASARGRTDLASWYGDQRSSTSTATTRRLRVRSALERGRERTQGVPDRHAEAGSCRAVPGRTARHVRKLRPCRACGSAALPTDSDTPQSGGLEHGTHRTPALGGGPLTCHYPALERRAARIPAGRRGRPRPDRVPVWPAVGGPVPRPRRTHLRRAPGPTGTEAWTPASVTTCG